nr:carbohydrate-binding domain-containing protein [bacterium]
MKKKHFPYPHTVFIFLMCAIIIFTMAGCSAGQPTPAPGDTAAPSGATPGTGTQQGTSTTPAPVLLDIPLDGDDTNDTLEAADMVTIALSDGGITVSGEGAQASGSTVTITSAGVYRLSGQLTDGQVRVSSPDKGCVRLILDGVDIRCATSAPLYILEADKTVITLAEGSRNRLADGTAYTYADGEDEPNACLFSKDDLTINGAGALEVSANANNGIGGKDDVTIVNGNITVNAQNNGIKGKDNLYIAGGTLTVTSGGDALKSDNATDAGMGNIIITGGTLVLNAGEDGLQAEYAVLIGGGELTIQSGGGAAKAPQQTGQGMGGWGGGWGMQQPGSQQDTTSTKGIKAGNNLSISGGTFTLDCADDALHTNGDMQISGGTFTLGTGDDGMHADGGLCLSGGDITITTCYEGLEAMQLSISGGNLRLNASDDGLNAADGSGTAGFGRPGQGNSNCKLTISGGTLAVDAGGDGLDSNGSIEMSGGTVLVNGPVNDGNGALDCDGTFTLAGGTLVAVGSSGMAQVPNAAAGLCCLNYTFAGQQAAGTPVALLDEDNRPLIVFVPTKAYRNIIISTPDMAKGQTVSLYTGGSASGQDENGLCQGYTPGTLVESITLTDQVTTGGSAQGGMRPGGNMPGGNVPGGEIPGENNGMRPGTKPGR